MDYAVYLLVLPLIAVFVVVPRWARHRYPDDALVAQSLVNSLIIGLTLLVLTVVLFVLRRYGIGFLMSVGTACFLGIAAHMTATGRLPKKT